MYYRSVFMKGQTDIVIIHKVNDVIECSFCKSKLDYSKAMFCEHFYVGFALRRVSRHPKKILRELHSTEGCKCV